MKKHQSNGKHLFYLIMAQLPWVPEAFHARFPVSVGQKGLKSIKES